MESNQKNTRYPVLEWLLGEIGDEEYLRWLAAEGMDKEEASALMASVKRHYAKHPMEKAKDILFWRQLNGEIDDEGFVKGLVEAGMPTVLARAELHSFKTGKGYL